MKTEGNPNQKGNPNEHKPSLKERAAYQLKEFLGMFVYVWVLFGLSAIHKSIILAEEHINYQAQGFAIVNALILAKVMLIGEDLHLGSELRDKSLLYSILYKSLVFSVFHYRLSRPRRDASRDVQGEYHFSEHSDHWWRKSARTVILRSVRVCRHDTVFCIQRSR